VVIPAGSPARAAPTRGKRLIQAASTARLPGRTEQRVLRLADCQDHRVTRVAAMTRERKTAGRGTSAAVLGLPFRLLAPTGLLRWFFNRQRLIHTFATNLRGPAEPLTSAGVPVRAVIPIPNTTGNVTVTFAVLSYAGTLRICIMSDPGRVSDVAVLVAAIRRELHGAAI
jgi:diacylglycerol O-acyltransferase